MVRNLSILIRTSGGLAPKKQLGFGHIYRSANLAESLKPNKIKFLVEDFGGSKEVLLSKGFSNIDLLEKNISVSKDIEKTTHQIENNKIDLLIIDRYRLTKQYVNTVSKFVKTVVISDLRLLDFNADLVVNGFVGFPNKIIKNRYGTRCIIGPKFQILDKNYMKLKKFKKNITLLATFGGYDECKIIDALLKSLANYIDKMKVKIILGPVTKKSANLNKFKKIYGNNLIITQKTNSMSKQIASAKYGLCSGGITTYEFAAYKIPFAIISQVKHQKITSIEWQKRKVAFDLGMKNQHTENRIKKYLGMIIKKKLSLNAKHNIVDGYGSKRVAKIIIGLFD